MWRASKRTLVVSISFVILFSGTGFFAQETSAQNEALTLSRAVAIALQTNPATRITAASRQMADAQLKEARAGRLPSLQVSETFTNSNNPVFVFGSLLEQGRFGPQNLDINSLNHPSAISNFRSALTLRLPIFDQRQTRTRVDRAHIGQQQADQQSELVAQQIRLSVIRTYYAVLLAQARLAVSDEAVKTAEADVKRARDMFESGLTVQSDLLAARVQLAEFRQLRIEEAGELATAMAALNTSLGLPAEDLHQLSGRLSERDFAVESLETLSRQALKNRPEYQRALLSVRESAVQLRGARGEWQPRVDAFISAGASSQYLVNGSGDYAMGASVTFNVFDAGRKARINYARASESMANADAEQIANQIRFEVVRAYQQYVSARERQAVVAEVTAQANETLRIIQDRYREGLTTITELLRAETALVRARTDVLNARYDQHLGYANLLLASGQLKDVGAFGS
jgi:outer membrane protein